MGNRFESAKWIVDYKEEDNIVLLKWKEEVVGDDFRTPMMHAAEFVRQHEESVLLVDRTDITHVDDKDKVWAKKIFIPNLKKASCKRIIFVVQESDINSKNDKYPYSDVADKFRIDKVLSYEDALKKIGKSQKASPEILKMTKAEALDYMGLKPDATDFFIDEKFWQLSKNLRLENSPETEQKIIDLSAAYHIATGRRDEEKKKKEIHDNAKKIFGKTDEEWNNHFRYNWIKYVVAVVIILSLYSIVKSIAFGKAECSVVQVGHFAYFGSYLDDLYESKGFKNPYISSTDIVVPNDIGEIETIYSEQASSIILQTASNLIVTEKVTYKYYYYNFMDMSETYEYLKGVVPAEIYDKLTPVYCSERECMQLSQEYLEKKHMLEEREDLSQYSERPVMVGLMIEDKDLIEKMGYDILWPEEYCEPNIIICISSSSKEFKKSQDMIQYLLQDLA